MPISLIPASLDLRQYFIKEMRFAVNENFDRAKFASQDYTYPELSCSVIEHNSEGNPREWQFELRVESPELGHGVDLPYSIAVVLSGQFVVEDGYAEEQVSVLARTNGPSVLYSAAREIILNTTARTGFPPTKLPTVRFVPSPDSSEPVEELGVGE